MNVTVIKSNRKTVSIQVNPDLSVTMRVPLRTSSREVERILKEKEQWILKHIEIISRKRAEYETAAPGKLTNEELRELADMALKYIPERVAYFASIIGVNYGNITIRNQKTRWGSCSNKGNLNFNCMLMLLPSELIDYVVVHELCHRKEMNHSKAFWAEVGKVLPNYMELRNRLKEEGNKGALPIYHKFW